MNFHDHLPRRVPSKLLKCFDVPLMFPGIRITRSRGGFHGSWAEITNRLHGVAILSPEIIAIRVHPDFPSSFDLINFSLSWYLHSASQERHTGPEIYVILYSCLREAMRACYHFSAIRNSLGNLYNAIQRKTQKSFSRTNCQWNSTGVVEELFEWVSSTMR